MNHKLRREQYLAETGRRPACRVEYCRERCPVLPADAQVNRVSRRALCHCLDLLTHPKHLRFAYPNGMRHCIRDCRGDYWRT